MSSEALRAAREAAEGGSLGEALAALKRARAEFFRARDVDGLRHVLALAVGLRGRAPAALETLIAAVEQNIRVLGPPPADPRPAVEEPPQPSPAVDEPSPPLPVTDELAQPVPAGGAAVFGYATVARRFGAWLADGVVIVVVAIIAGRAFGRWLVTFLFWMFFIIPGILDALSASWHDRDQAWHDRAAGTIVVLTCSPPVLTG